MALHSVFISYAHRPPDDRLVASLIGILEDLGQDVWSDRLLEQRGGTALNTEIAIAIERARCVVVAVSGQSLASDYCQAEIAYALEQAKPIIRIDLERLSPSVSSRMRGVLPIFAPVIVQDAITWTDDRAAMNAALRIALASRGISSGSSRGDRDSDPTRADPADHPDAHIIRPAYRDLDAFSPDSLRSFRDRLIKAGALAPENGYNALSLGFLHLAIGDLAEARSAMASALRNLPDEPDAHYGTALVACRRSSGGRRNLPTTQDILRTLASARRLHSYGAHIDLLTALVVCNFYLARRLTPPIAIERLLEMATERPIDVDELSRVRDCEPLDTERVPRDVSTRVENWLDEAIRTSAVRR